MTKKLKPGIKIKSRLSWMKVKPDEGLLARGIPEELVGIEELRDYTLVKRSIKSSNIKKPKEQIINEKKLKKKKDLIQQEQWHVTESMTKGDPKTKSKRKTQLTGKNNNNNKPMEAILKHGTLGNELENTLRDAESMPENLSERMRNIVSEATSNGQEKENELFEVTPDMMIWKAMFLPDEILKAVWELGFINPTPIQLAVLPTAMKGRRDVVGAAETGSGKTLAFGIPILYGILKDKEFERKKGETASGDSDEQFESDEKTLESEAGMITEKAEEESGSSDPEGEEVGGDCGLVRVVDLDRLPKNEKYKGGKLRSIIITPTRELAVQIEKHLKDVAKYTDIRIALVIGGMAPQKQERLLNKGPDIVIGTPGRLWELIELGNPHLSQISDIRYLALDETDRLLERGHFQELRTLLEKINKDDNKARWRQNFVFSATLTLAHDLPVRIGNKKKREKNQTMKLDKLLAMVGVRPKAKIVDLTAAAKDIKPATLSEMKLYSASLEDKDYYLYYFLRHHPGRTLIFCNSINSVRRLTSVFTLLGMHPLPLHAQMHQKQRLKHLEKFSSVENSLLIATDVAARGLDIPNVQHVVHFQVPRTSENYVHRSGRTARASRDGLSLMLIEPSEANLYRKLCNNLKKGKSDLEDYDVDMRVFGAIKERVNLARAIEALEHRTKRAKSDESWVKKMAEEAEIMLDDGGNESDDGMAAHHKASLNNELKQKKKELKQLLMRPLKRSVV